MVEESDFAGIRNDPYSRNLEEYKAVFDKEVHGGTMYSWHDEGFKEKELWESGLDEKYYDPLQVCVETFEVKRYSFEVGKSFIHVTKQLEDALPLGRVNGSRFKGMIQKEMDTGVSVQKETYTRLVSTTKKWMLVIILAQDYVGKIVASYSHYDVVITTTV
ncbi:hypothetical protein Tco_0050690 [Tanacetum coccineum]